MLNISKVEYHIKIRHDAYNVSQLHYTSLINTQDTEQIKLMLMIIDAKNILEVQIFVICFKTYILMQVLYLVCKHVETHVSII